VPRLSTSDSASRLFKPRNTATPLAEVLVREPGSTRLATYHRGHPRGKMAGFQIRQSGLQRRCELAEITNVAHMAGGWPTSSQLRKIGAIHFLGFCARNRKRQVSRCVKSPQTERRGAALSPSSQRLILPKVYPVFVRPSRDWHSEFVDFGLERVERRFPEKYRSRGGSTTSASLNAPPPCTHGPPTW
jgi:hypothetical protein